MKPRRRRRPRRKGKRGIFVLPSLFTSASLFCGFYAIISAIHSQFETAAIAILISWVLDSLDGKIARITRTTSHFGGEYDSLSDLVAFGVAPAVLAFQWALEPFGRLGWLACFMFVICGALRLARFNVQKSSLEPNYFKGLPIPAAASFIASLVLFMTTFEGAMESRHTMIIVSIYVLSFLMVSSIDYLSFKEFELRGKKPFNVLVGLILMLIVIAYRPKIMLFLILVIYVVSGPIITLYRLRKKRVRAKAFLEDTPPAEND